jgi:hypothetical protein
MKTASAAKTTDAAMCFFDVTNAMITAAGGGSAYDPE